MPLCAYFIFVHYLDYFLNVFPSLLYSLFLKRYINHVGHCPWTILYITKNVNYYTILLINLWSLKIRKITTQRLGWFLSLWVGLNDILVLFQTFEHFDRIFWRFQTSKGHNFFTNRDCLVRFSLFSSDTFKGKNSENMIS